MTTKIVGGLRGVDHIAYPTWKLEETVHFYRDVLGFPLQHCILAPGWGKDPHPDFAHFFFDIGGGGRIAFFYYFGVPHYVDENVPDRINKARHTALQVDTLEELDGYHKRIEAAGYELRFRVMHELIESIYVWDPNGYAIEISRPLRKLGDVDVTDSGRTIQALIDVTREPEPSIAKVWSRKAELIGGPLVPGTGSLFFADIEENGPIWKCAAGDGLLELSRADGYVEVRFSDELTIDRVSTGARHAVWYSCVGGLRDARIVRFDGVALRVVAESGS